MSKPLRTILQGVTYHCYTRCHGKKNLFHSSYVRQYLVKAIVMCQEKYQTQIKITLHQYFVDLGNTFEECIKKFLWYEEAYLKRIAVVL